MGQRRQGWEWENDANIRASVSVIVAAMAVMMSIAMICIGIIVMTPVVFVNVPPVVSIGPMVSIPPMVTMPPMVSSSIMAVIPSAVTLVMPVLGESGTRRAEKKGCTGDK